MRLYKFKEVPANEIKVCISPICEYWVGLGRQAEQSAGIILGAFDPNIIIINKGVLDWGSAPVQSACHRIQLWEILKETGFSEAGDKKHLQNTLGADNAGEKNG